MSYGRVGAGEGKVGESQGGSGSAGERWLLAGVGADLTRCRMYCAG